MGGLLSENSDAEASLISASLNLSKKLGVSRLELRHARPLASINPIDDSDSFVHHGVQGRIFTQKVRLILKLPGSGEVLMKSFKSKLRSQIKKPIKEGLTAKVGGAELLDDFYNVFVVNMRDLGSPVHAKRLIHTVVSMLEPKARIVAVYKGDKPVAASVLAGFQDTLENPWSSSLRSFNHLSPNMLLYWTMLEYGCENGYKYFDFGRSTPDEGTYRFKKQWGAVEERLYWYQFFLKDQGCKASTTTQKDKYDAIIEIWRRLPVTLSRVIGPWIRKNIGL
jgi:FemAB-related protein (PEP-CTERM system-associated)